MYREKGKSTGKNTVNTRKDIFLLFVLFLYGGEGDKNETQSPSLFWDIRRYWWIKLGKWKQEKNEYNINTMQRRIRYTFYYMGLRGTTLLVEIIVSKKLAICTDTSIKQ